MSSIRVQCDACDGTGIYHGFAEPEGVGVVCLECNGAGCCVIEYTPFHGRQTRKDIKFVHMSGGRFLAVGIGPTGPAVSYEDFLKGIMPVKRITTPLVDPEAGDKVRARNRTRLVLRRSGGEVFYKVLEQGNALEHKCWITTWRSWCYLNKATVVEQVRAIEV